MEGPKLKFLLLVFVVLFKGTSKNLILHNLAIIAVQPFLPRSSHGDRRPADPEAYYNVYRDQGLRQASFRLIGQTLTPFFNDTDLDAGRAYGYQAGLLKGVVGCG